MAASINEHQIQVAMRRVNGVSDSHILEDSDVLGVEQLNDAQDLLLPLLL